MAGKYKRPKEKSTKRGGARPGAGRSEQRRTLNSKTTTRQSNSKRGRLRPGAGRKPGPVGFEHKPNHRTLSLRERFHNMPLEHMLCVMNGIDPDTQQPKQFSMSMRNEMARAAAPFLHPKLSNVNLQARQKYSVDVDKLSDDELIEFERLLLKCQVPAGQQTPEEVAEEVINGDYEILPPGANKSGSETSH